MDIATFRRVFVVREEGVTKISTKNHRPRCFLNDQDHCSVYSVRPKQCRTYPDWPELWENPHLLQAEIARCPGLRKAVEGFDQKL